MSRILFLLLACLCMGCETMTNVYYSINNASATPLIVSGEDVIHNWQIQDTIPAGASLVIGSWSKLGKTTDNMPATDQFGQTLLITRINGDTSTKNWTDPAVWALDLTDARAVATHRYTLSIADSDF